mgnify:FL=1
MADNMKRLVYEIELNDKGKAKVEGLTKGFIQLDNAINRVVTDVKKQQGAMSSATTKGLNPMIDKTGLAGATVTELGRTISDANYGIRGMANNLQQLSSLFVTLIATTGGLANGLKAIGKVLMGPLGLIIIFQTLITLLEGGKLSMGLFSAEVRKLNSALTDGAKAVGGEVGELRLLVDIAKDETISRKDRQDALDKAIKTYPEYLENITLENIKTEESSKAIERQIKLLTARAKVQSLTNLITKESEKIFEAQANIQNKSAEQFASFGDFAMAFIKGFGNAQASAAELTRNAINSQNKTVENSKGIIAMALEEIKKILNETPKVYETINKERKKQSEEDNKYDELEISNFDKKIRALREMGKIRTHFFNRNLEMDVVENENTIEAIELERKQTLSRLDSLKELGLAEEELAVAKYEVNLFYTKLLAQEQERLDRIGFAMRMQMFGHYADALGSISGLMKENSEAAKTFALLEIAANTAIGFTQGLIVAQKQAREGLALAFPLFYASQIAAVLAAANRAKSILSTGDIGGAGGGAVGGVGVEAPDFNVVGASPESQLAQSVSRQQTQPLRAFVVNKDIRDAEELDRTIDFNRSLG